jgi:hypothetical protein
MFRQRRHAESARIFYSECNLTENNEILQLRSHERKVTEFQVLAGALPPPIPEIQCFLTFA